MTPRVALYAAVLVTASLISAVVALAATRRRAVPGGGAFALMMWAVVCWTLMSGLGGVRLHGARLALRCFSIRSMVAAPGTTANTDFLSAILRERTSNFVSTDYLF
jgi:hypothetical protein